LAVRGKVSTFALAFEKQAPQRRGGALRGRLAERRRRGPQNVKEMLKSQKHLRDSKIVLNFAKSFRKRFRAERKLKTQSTLKELQ